MVVTAVTTKGDDKSRVLNVDIRNLPLHSHPLDVPHASYVLVSIRVSHNTDLVVDRNIAVEFVCLVPVGVPENVEDVTNVVSLTDDVLKHSWRSLSETG